MKWRILRHFEPGVIPGPVAAATFAECDGMLDPVYVENRSTQFTKAERNLARKARVDWSVSVPLASNFS